MNDAMITNWNRVVKESDWVYHLGDFALFGREGLKLLLSRLNGHKVLIKGNHDGGSAQKYLEAGFELVYEYPIIVDDLFILSHEPVVVEGTRFFNIHGHIHQKTMADWRNFNASVEHTNYTPIKLEKIKKILTENVDIYRNL